MCKHKKIVIIPTEETSWGIANTYNIKCSDCHKLLFENIAANELHKCVAALQPSNVINLSLYQ